MAVIEAHVTKVEQEIGSDWFAVSTDHDQVKKLTTKKREVAEGAAAVRVAGSLAKITFTQRDREANGRTYHNYYLDSAEPIATNGASGGIDQVAPVGRKTDPAEAWRICLAAGGKLAVATMPLMPVEQRDFETQKRLAVAWARFFFYTPMPTEDDFAATATTRSTSAPGTYDEPGNYSAPSPMDEDIPFLWPDAYAPEFASSAAAVTR